MTEVAGAAAAADVLTGDPRPHAGLEQAEAHGDCANCGTHLAGAYCHACGQRAHLHSKLWHLVQELFEGIAHFDGRFWRTLPLLAFRPGRLSRTWIEGKRARHVSPLHIFLFAIFLLFIIPTFTGRHLISLPGGEATSATAGPAGASDAASPSTGPVQVTVEDELQDAPFIQNLNERWKKVKENRDYYGYKIETLAYKLSFVVVPISMAILWLLTIFKRGYSFYDHGVVALYGVGFLVFLTALISLFPPSMADGFGAALAVIAPVHATVHLHGAYRLSWFGAAVRALLLGVFSLIGFGLFIAGVFALGIFS